MIADVKKSTEQKMQKSVEALKADFSKVRTGRAHTGLLDHITVDYYGTPTPVNQIANITLLDARTIGVSPWEKRMAGAIEKAIRDADLGLNPATVGEVVRVPMPALTEERRKDLIKVVKHEAENARVAVRNIRRDANAHLKELLKDQRWFQLQRRLPGRPRLPCVLGSGARAGHHRLDPPGRRARPVVPALCPVELRRPVDRRGEGHGLAHLRGRDAQVSRPQGGRRARRRLFPHYLGRMDRNHANRPDTVRNTGGRKPSEFLRAFHYDTCVYDPQVLKVLLERVGADRLVMGSDYPVGEKGSDGFFRKANRFMCR